MALRSVSLSETDYADYYEGFSNGTLWPLYHNGLLSTRFRRSWWAAYRRVNEQFAKVAIETTEQDGTLWIHDYHLQLMPAFVREARPDIRIGLFLHTPFPPSQLLMRLPWREAITDGLLATDVIGFQTPTDARNFLSLAHRMGRTEEVMPVDPVTEITVEGRRVAVGSFPISVDVDRIDEMVRTRPPGGANAFRASLGSPKHLLLGVDRLDYTKGIDARLKAFEELLATARSTPPRSRSSRSPRPAVTMCGATPTPAPRSSSWSVRSTATSHSSAGRCCTICTRACPSRISFICSSQPTSCW